MGMQKLCLCGAGQPRDSSGLPGLEWRISAFCSSPLGYELFHNTSAGELTTKGRARGRKGGCRPEWGRRRRRHTRARDRMARLAVGHWRERLQWKAGAPSSWCARDDESRPGWSYGRAGLMAIGVQWEGNRGTEGGWVQVNFSPRLTRLRTLVLPRPRTVPRRDPLLSKRAPSCRHSKTRLPLGHAPPSGSAASRRPRPLICRHRPLEVRLCIYIIILKKLRTKFLTRTGPRESAVDLLAILCIEQLPPCYAV